MLIKTKEICIIKIKTVQFIKFDVHIENNKKKIYKY